MDSYHHMPNEFAKFAIDTVPALQKRKLMASLTDFRSINHLTFNGGAILLDDAADSAAWKENARLARLGTLTFLHLLYRPRLSLSNENVFQCFFLLALLQCHVQFSVDIQ